MNEGVKILLERIKTNPDEFTEQGKWAKLLHDYKDFLSNEDLKVISEKINELMSQKFTKAVMKELLAPEEDDGLGKWYTKQGNVTLSAGVTQGAYTVNNSGTITSWEEREPLSQNHQAHIDAHAKALQKQKKHQTLFGKLFNYS